MPVDFDNVELTNILQPIINAINMLEFRDFRVLDNIVGNTIAHNHDIRNLNFDNLQLNEISAYIIAHSRHHNLVDVLHYIDMLTTRVTSEEILVDDGHVGFMWDRHMDTGGPQPEPEAINAYQNIIDLAITQGVMTENEIPQEFICPITMTIMTNPVFNDSAAGGRVHYDREALVRWVEDKEEDSRERRGEIEPMPIRDPFNNVITGANIRSNDGLRNQIDEFMQGIMTRMTLDHQPRPR